MLNVIFQRKGQSLIKTRENLNAKRFFCRSLFSKWIFMGLHDYL